MEAWQIFPMCLLGWMLCGLVCGLIEIVIYGHSIATILGDGSRRISIWDVALGFLHVAIFVILILMVIIQMVGDLLQWFFTKIGAIEPKEDQDIS